MKEGAEEVYTTEVGEKLTVWEHTQLKNEINIANRRLQRELKELEKPYSSGYSKAQMGAIEYKEILAQIRNLKELEKKSGYEFTRLKDRIHSLGTLDYETMKATIYRQNFMTALEESSANLEGYDLLLKKLNRIKNPINFYNFIKQSDSFSDIFLYYKPR